MIQNLASIIIPVKNESGNILPIIDGFKNFKYQVELIFVVGLSDDGTEKTVSDAIACNKDIDIRYIAPEFSGKGNAVWAGFKIARGSILAILDGDLTIPHSSLEKMLEKCFDTNSVVCGNRLLKINFQSFPLPNFLYNKIISLIFNLRFKKNINDILCGSKVIPFQIYQTILPYRNFFSSRDRWGDLEILSAASTCGYSILSVNVDYLPRSYGASKISIFQDGSSFLFFLGSTLIKKDAAPIE